MKCDNSNKNWQTNNNNVCGVLTKECARQYEIFKKNKLKAHPGTHT